MTPESFGLYVHIPFCLRKCNYCDFCSFSGWEKERRAAYIRALIREILSYRGNGVPHPTVTSVFFGGGTPSLLTPGEISEIMGALRETFHLAPEAEITAEVNPGALTSEALDAFCREGFCRISIGLQSINENELKILGRIHTAQDFRETYRAVRAVGINNVNVDIMYDIPEQTPESFDRTLEAVLALSPEHISAYSLIVEDGTPFGDRRDTLVLPGEEAELSMVAHLTSRLHNAGYQHYEISNYAKPGYACRHNLTYWHDAPYLGFGVAAASYFDGKRYTNTRDPDAYISAGYKKNREVQVLRPEDVRYEYAMLALRLTEGLSLSEYRERFGLDFTAGKEKLLARLAAAGYLTMDAQRLSLTETGFYVSNEILTQIL